MKAIEKVGALMFIIVSYIMFILGFICSKYSDTFLFQHFILVLAVLLIISKILGVIIDYFFNITIRDNDDLE